MEGWIGREISQKLYTVESTAMNIKFLALHKDVKQTRSNDGQNNINLRIHEKVLLFLMGQKARKDHIQSHIPWSQQI